MPHYSRNNDGCTIISLFIFVIYALFQAITGNFSPLLVIFGIIGVIVLIIVLAKSYFAVRESIESANENNTDYGRYVLIALIGGGAFLAFFFKNNSYSDTEPILLESPIVPESAYNADLPDSSIVADKTIDIANYNLGNCKYQIPNNLELDASSDQYKQLFFDFNSNLSLTVHFDESSDSLKGKSIDYFLPILADYAERFNENSQANFDDFKLLNYSVQKVGNQSAFMFEQESTKVSGIKNIPMFLTTYNVISQPYIYSITFSFPKDSISYLKMRDDIIGSFKFASPIGRYIVSANQSEKIHLYNAPFEAHIRSAYFIGGEILTVEKIVNDFGYVNYTNDRGLTSIGWVKMKYLNIIYNR